jgi:hypothetical protein
MRINLITMLLLLLIILPFSSLQAQRDKDSTYCKVYWKSLEGKYVGDCKEGMANGKGEAWGINHYVGSFKDGMPNGNGVYHYGDSLYYSGDFQDGLKEGKGEMHYQLKDKPDSVVKGFWSADEYRGSKYITNQFTTTGLFDHVEITPSRSSGKSVTIELSTTSGSPNGAPTGGGPGYVLTLANIMSPTGSIVKQLSKMETSSKSITSYELSGFPCRIFCTLSSGDTFELEMYKAANWKVRIYVNK